PICVFDNACVYGNAWVSGNARVFDNACVYGNAWVYMNAGVYRDVHIYGNAQVFGNAWIYGNLKIKGGRFFYTKLKSETIERIENDEEYETLCINPELEKEPRGKKVKIKLSEGTIVEGELITD
ncbi:MAG: hypothetical protein PHO28_04005, partial [Candidatus Pacebacteria bacterium]|nr:hypothetical protein [Candidatus Paceibacterota bacterium]